MSISITTLIENSGGADPLLKSEHGLSFFIERNQNRFLFDTGASGAFLLNAKRLGINPFDVEKVLISHGHWDHSGGVRPFLDSIRRTKAVEFSLHSDFFIPKYGTKEGKTRPNGNNFTAKDILDAGCSIKWIDEDLVEIFDGVFVLSHFERTHTEEKNNPRFQLLKNDSLEIDPFEDEIMLAIDSSKGWILLVGCSHPGIMNMIDTAKKRLSGPIYAILGGTHLVEADSHRLDQCISYFKQIDCPRIGLSHCTGPDAIKRFQGLDSRFFHNVTGSLFMVP